VVQRLKGRVLVADWSVPKNEFSGGTAVPNIPAEQAPTAASTDGIEAQQEADMREGSAAEEGPPNGTPRDVKAGEVAKTKGSDGDVNLRKEAADGNEESDGPEALNDAAVHVGPGERRMYEDVLAGLLSEAATQEPPAKGGSGKGGEHTAAGNEHKKGDERKKQAKDGAGAKDEGGAAGKQGKKAAWEGERCEDIAPQKEEGAGLIQRQVFVRNLPLDVLSSELSSCMQRFGEVKACRSVLALLAMRHMHAVMHICQTVTCHGTKNCALPDALVRCRNRLLQWMIQHGRRISRLCRVGCDMLCLFQGP
jgi:hypothetical protein